MSKIPPLAANYQQALVPALLLFLSGTLLAQSANFGNLFWLGWLVLCAISMGICWMFAFGCSSLLKGYVCFLCFLLGGALGTFGQFEPSPDDISHWTGRSRAVVKGNLVSLGNAPGQWVMAVKSVDGRPSDGKVLLRYAVKKIAVHPLLLGQEVQIVGALSLPFSAQFPGDFDYQNYLRQQGITSILKAKEHTILANPSDSPLAVVLNTTDRLRLQLAKHFKQHLPSPESEILAGIVLGDHAVGVDPEVRSVFVRSGLVHILAASGMNVGLIAALILFTGKWCRLPLPVSLLIAMVGVAIYSLMTGLPPSVQRAGLMLELAFLLKLFRRELQPVTLLCLTGTLLVFFTPTIITMVGFQLSFMTAFGLLAMLGPLQEKLGFYLTRWGAGLLLVPVVAQLWATPFLWFHFNQVQLLSLPANLLALPLAALLTYAGFIAGIISLFLPQVSSVLLQGSYWVCHALLQTAAFFGNLPYATLYLQAPPVACTLLMVGLLILLTTGLHFPMVLPGRRLALTTGSVMLLILIPISLQHGQSQSAMQAIWLPDRSDSGVSILQLPYKTVIVSTPQLSSGLSRTLISYFREQGISRIALLHIINPQVKNLDGLDPLQKALPIQQIITPKPSTLQAQTAWNNVTTKLEVPLTLLAPTHLLKTPYISAMLFSTASGESLQRYALGNHCLTMHWHPTGNQPPHLSNLTKRCTISQEMEPGPPNSRITIDGAKATHWVKGFTHLDFQPNSIHYQTSSGESF